MRMGHQFGIVADQQVTAPHERLHRVDLIEERREAAYGIHRAASLDASDRGPLGNGVHFVTRADGHGAITVDIAEQIDTLLAQTGPPVVITVEDDGLTVVEVEAVP